MDNSVLYTKTHEWIKFVDDDTAIIGITDYGQELLGDILSIELPESGLMVEAEVTFADIEGVNLAAEVYSPASGIIAEVNEDISDYPERINESPYDAWLIKVEKITDTTNLLTENEYRNFTD